MKVQVQLKEVLLEDTDVAKAILDYINKNYINSIVVGASTRNAFARFFSLIFNPPHFTFFYLYDHHVM